MEKYVYYSLLIFSSFIFFLYIYLFYIKVMNFHELKNIKKYNETWTPYIDNLFMEMEEQYPSGPTLGRIRKEMRNKLKRKLTIEKVIYYTSTFTGTMRKNIKQFCEDTRLVEYILSDLKSKDDLKVALYCKILGEFRSVKAAPYLLNLLDKNLIDIKYNALMAIAKIGNEEYFIESFKKLKNNIPLSERSLIEIVDSFEGDKAALYEKMIKVENAYISTIFIKSAGNYMDPQFNEDISKYLKEENKDRKIAAIKVIGQTADARFIQDLIDSLKDDSWEVRAMAAKSLGRIEDSEALPFLVQALSDREWWVRYNSAQAVFKIPKGIEMINKVFSGNDSFAKDSMVYALEASGTFAELYLYAHSTDFSKRKLARIIKEYIRELEEEEKKNGVELN